MENVTPKAPLISIVMPAYNAERTIELALRSIRMQTIADQIEILVIDGGSTDATREIARQYGAVILENPHRLPEPAKLIGIQRAKGRYIIEQDTDEELLFPDQLEKRLSLLRAYPEVHLVVVDEQAPGRLGGVATRYVCVCGDPFTQFIYTRKNGVLDTFRRNIAEQQGDFCLFKFAPGDLTPIGDGGVSLFDLEWIKQQFPQDWNSISFVCSMAQQVQTKSGCCGCIRGDNIHHHTRATFSGYLAKLRFRVINNLFHKEESGFSARASQQPRSRYTSHKYLFVLYAATLVGPLVDSIRLALHHKDATMLLHFVYVYYTCLCIAWYLLRALLGCPPENKTYGK